MKRGVWRSSCRARVASSGRETPSTRGELSPIITLKPAETSTREARRFDHFISVFLFDALFYGLVNKVLNMA